MINCTKNTDNNAFANADPITREEIAAILMSPDFSDILEQVRFVLGVAAKLLPPASNNLN